MNSQTEAQKVMDVIENPEVINALRQDKLQNLQFLKDNYGVCATITLLIMLELLQGRVFMRIM